MASAISTYITNLLLSWHLSREFVVVFLAAFPIMEVRGAMLVASLLKVEPLTALFLGIFGNLLPIPFLIYLLRPVFNWMRKWKIFVPIVEKLEKKAEKNKSKIEKWEFFGLLCLVAIPLPGTGAWTGCLVASVFNVNKKTAILANSIGVVIASTIMWVICYGILGKIF